jgi:hypothetical protein
MDIAALLFGITGVGFTLALIPVLAERYGFKVRGLNLRTSAVITTALLGLTATAIALSTSVAAAVPTIATAAAWGLIAAAPSNPRKFQRSLKRGLLKLSNLVG